MKKDKERNAKGKNPCNPNYYTGNKSITVNEAKHISNSVICKNSHPDYYGNVNVEAKGIKDSVNPYGTSELVFTF